METFVYVVLSLQYNEVYFKEIYFLKIFNNKLKSPCFWILLRHVEKKFVLVNLHHNWCFKLGIGDQNVKATH